MKETEGLIKSGLNSTPDQEYGNFSQGTDTSGLLNQDSGMNQSLSYGDQALSSAIKGKYSRPFQVQQQGLQNKMKIDARNAHFEKVLTAHHLANEEANLNFQKELIKYKQKKQKQAQRGAVIGQVLGLTGAIVGGIYGGPAGAAAGGAAGSAGGQSAGNSQLLNGGN